MKALVWNMRGFRAKGHCNFLRDYIRDNHINLVCLQETIKDSFSLSDLSSLVGADVFCCKWLPALGHSGGI